MQVRVSGKQLEIGETLPEQVRTRLNAAIEKHFDRGSSASVVFLQERTGFHVDCHVHLDSGTEMQAEGRGSDAYRAFDDLLKHVETQLRRQTRKLKSHHEKKTPSGDI
jgi:ribosomal subunit interface protein